MDRLLVDQAVAAECLTLFVSVLDDRVGQRRIELERHRKSSGNPAPHRLPDLPPDGGVGPDRQRADVGRRAAAPLHPAARAARARRHGDRDEDVRPRVGPGARVPGAGRADSRGRRRDVLRDRRLDPRPRRDLRRHRADVRRRARLSRRAQGRDLRRDSRDARRRDPAAPGDGDRRDGGAVPQPVPPLGRGAARAERPARSPGRVRRHFRRAADVRVGPRRRGRQRRSGCSEKKARIAAGPFR